MSITINDGVSEKGAATAMDNLMEITHLMVKIKLLIGQVEAECGADVSEIEHAHGELETASSMVFQEIFEAAAEYNSDAMHTETLENTGRAGK